MMKDDSTASTGAYFPKDRLSSKSNSGVNALSSVLLRRMISYSQCTLSWNVQRCLLLLFILLQVLFFTWHLASQRAAIEDNAERVLRNTALLETQQFEASMDALYYQVRVIGNAILLNHTVDPGDAKPFLDEELKRDWLDAVIVFNANGTFVAKGSEFPLEQVLDKTILAQQSFRNDVMFKSLRREEVNDLLFYSEGSGFDPLGTGFVMYHAVRDPDGRYLGGSIGYFRSTTMTKFFMKMEKNGFSLGRGGVMAVLDRETGIQFARMGADASDHRTKTFGSFLLGFSADNAEAHRYVSPIDGVSRLGVFLNLNKGKWVLTVGLAESDLLHGWYSQVGLTALGVIIMAILQWLLLHYVHANSLQREALAREAGRDPLTGLANRRHFDEWAQGACSLARRYQSSLCVLAIDLDYFKQINDSYGHDGGDAVLRQVADRLRGALRGADIAARFGGEEFVVAMPHTGLEMAVEVAERIRTTLAALAVAYKGQEIHVTASVGVTELTPDELDVSEGIHTGLARADQALYRAKQDGRNRVTVANEEREESKRLVNG